HVTRTSARRRVVERHPCGTGPRPRIIDGACQIAGAAEHDEALAHWIPAQLRTRASRWRVCRHGRYVGPVGPIVRPGFVVVDKDTSGAGTTAEHHDHTAL